MARKLITTYYDNRDMITTEIVLETGQRTDINPFDVLENALVNSHYPDGIAKILLEYFDGNPSRSDETLEERLADLGEWLVQGYDTD